MASKTKATEIKRSNRNKRMGTRRKAADRTKGSTKNQKTLFGD